MKEELLQSLKQELKMGKVREVVHKYLVRLPTEEAHHTCHPTKGAIGFSQRIHPDIIVKIQEIAQEVRITLKILDGKYIKFFQMVTVSSGVFHISCLKVKRIIISFVFY